MYFPTTLNRNITTVCTSVLISSCFYFRYQVVQWVGITKKMGNAIYDTGVVKPYLRHRVLFAPHAPDHSGTSTAVLAWCRDFMEAIVYPKTAQYSTRYVVSACTPAEYSDWCRKSLLLNLPSDNVQGITHSERKILYNLSNKGIYDTGVANTLFTTR